MPASFPVRQPTVLTIPGHHRATPGLLLAVVLVAVSTLTRVVLWLHPGTGRLDFTTASAAFLIGFAFDAIIAIFVCAPLFLLLMLVSDRLAATRAWRSLVVLLWAVATRALPDP